MCKKMQNRDTEETSFSFVGEHKYEHQPKDEAVAKKQALGGGTTVSRGKGGAGGSSLSDGGEGKFPL